MCKLKHYKGAARSILAERCQTDWSQTVRVKQAGIGLLKHE